MKSKSSITKRRREVPFLNYDVNDFQDYETISEHVETKKVVFITLLEAVSHSIANKKKKADIFMLNDSQCVELERDKWANSLQKAIDFFSSEDIEDYESCKKCKELIDKI
jgi:hypothetical protein